MLRTWRYIYIYIYVFSKGKGGDGGGCGGPWYVVVGCGGRGGGGVVVHGDAACSIKYISQDLQYSFNIRIKIQNNAELDINMHIGKGS